MKTIHTVENLCQYNAGYLLGFIIYYYYNIYNIIYYYCTSEVKEVQLREPTGRRTEFGLHESAILDKRCERVGFEGEKCFPQSLMIDCKGTRREGSGSKFTLWRNPAQEEEDCTAERTVGMVSSSY